MSLPWFRMYAEFSGDPIIQSLAFEDQRHYVVLLCLKCSGVLDRKLPEGRRDTIIARGLGLDSYAAEEAKRRLQEVGLVTDGWQPTAWKKRQYKSDNSTERVRNYREKLKKKAEDETFQKRDGNAPETETETETEVKDKSANADSSPAVADEPAACPHDEIIAIYHAELPMLRRVREWNEQRRKMLRTRWREKPDRQHLDWWRKFFAFVRDECPFLVGDVKDFQADLEWLIRPTNFVKVIEGKYQREDRPHAA